jgi:hypothetical protein
MKASKRLMRIRKPSHARVKAARLPVRKTQALSLDAIVLHAYRRTLRDNDTRRVLRACFGSDGMWIEGA